MKLYRISSCKYVNDLTGTGARLYGGRWNSIGKDMLYFASSRSLAALETLVHLPVTLLPLNLCLLVVEVPEESLEEVNVTQLPANWREYPAPNTLKKYGDGFITASDKLILKVPSVVITEEFNYLINLKHIDIVKLKIVKSQPFILDDRLV